MQKAHRLIIGDAILLLCTINACSKCPLAVIAKPFDPPPCSGLVGVCSRQGATTVDDSVTARLGEQQKQTAQGP